ncbi:hypothetical protein [Pseudomonas sp. FR229a]|uniref:hypothetical protein n=1 Tax=Pseudomonas sp. FR229a TaxID=3040313 RepID=UPI002556F4D0|nr:hypothetical protein [Pseudomonas sp. FR229a]
MTKGKITARRCNLCLKRSQMTEDHIFPQGIAIPGQRQVTKILHKVDPDFRGRQGTSLVQNGLKKSTLCADCNNRILGAKLDPALIKLCKDVGVQISLGRFPMLPSIVVQHIELNKVAKSVAGHLLALDEYPQATHKTARELRRFILRDDATLPPTLRFHMWLYPFNRQAIFKDLHHIQFGSGYDPFWISAFKTYPLAFAFSSEITNPSFRLPGVMDITEWVKDTPEQQYRLIIPTRPTVDPNWPFAAHKEGAILTGDHDSITTQPYKKNKI